MAPLNSQGSDFLEVRFCVLAGDVPVFSRRFLLGFTGVKATFLRLDAKCVKNALSDSLHVT